MRTSNIAFSAGLMALALGLSPAASFDGTRTPDSATVAVPLGRSDRAAAGQSAPGDAV
jgi:hypothetical protein